MIFLFCNRHIKNKYNMFKIKRNHKLHRFSVRTMLRNMNRYKPSKIRYAMFMNKIIATEAKYQPYECRI